MEGIFWFVGNLQAININFQNVIDMLHKSLERSTLTNIRPDMSLNKHVKQTIISVDIIPMYLHTDMS